MALPVVDLTRSSPSRDNAQQYPASGISGMTATNVLSKEESQELSEKELEVFLYSAPAHDLRSLLKIIFKRCEDANRIAQEEIREGNKWIGYTESQRRGDQQWKICVTCSKPYDTKGRDLVCVERHHPGELEPDDNHDSWGDWDPNCHGTIEDIKEDCPEAFLYDCCNQAFDTEGCESEVYHKSD